MRPNSPPPRMVWIFLGGIVALAAIYGLTLPPANSRTPSESSGSRIVKVAVQARGNTGKMEIAALSGYPAARPLAAYVRLQNRNVFRPLVKSKSSLVGDETASLSTKPAPFGPGLLPLVPPGFDGPATPQKSVGTWKYVGYSTVDGIPNAYLESTKDHQGRTTQVGDKVEGAMVVSVSQTGIRLMKGDSAILFLRTDPADASKPDKKDAAKAVSNSPQPVNGAPVVNGAPPAGGPQNNNSKAAISNSVPAPALPPIMNNVAPEIQRAEKIDKLELRL